MRKTQEAIFSSRQQQGATLVTTLIFLTLIVILTVSTLQTSELEQQMAGNLYTRNIAFQAAEATLRDAEKHLQGLSGLSGFSNNCDNGLCYSEGCFNNDILDFKSNAIVYGDQTGTSPLQGVSQQPRYLIEGIKYSEAGSAADDFTLLYRITAIASGKSNDSEVILTTTYRPR